MTAQTGVGSSSVYAGLARKLLLLRNHTFYRSPKNGRFGFDIKHNYSGLMAQPAKTGRNRGRVSRPKQGLFDIVIDVGSRYKSVTHKELFSDLLKHSSEQKCLEAWRGVDPRVLGRNDDEKEALIALTLLMFEQEVNWGSNEWQKSSNFSPSVRRPTLRRPRDMVMGFVRQAFAVGIDKMQYWMKVAPGTVWFYDRHESPYGYQTYPGEYKRYFTELEGMNGTEAVMIGGIRDEFSELAARFPDNPHYTV